VKNTFFKKIVSDLQSKQEKLQCDTSLVLLPFDICFKNREMFLTLSRLSLWLLKLNRHFVKKNMKISNIFISNGGKKKT